MPPLSRREEESGSLEFGVWSLGGDRSEEGRRVETSKSKRGFCFRPFALRLFDSLTFFDTLSPVGGMLVNRVRLLQHECSISRLQPAPCELAVGFPTSDDLKTETLTIEFNRSPYVRYGE